MLVVRIIEGSNTWEVVKFIKEHSHRLETPTKSYCLRSHRKVPDSQLDIAEGLHKVGVGVSKALQFFTEEIGGRDELGFSELDLCNALRCRRFSKYGGGAKALLEYFQQKYNEQSDFCYEIQVDNQNRLTSCFWVDGYSKKDYISN